MTLTYKVTLDSYSLDLKLFIIRDPKNLKTCETKKDHGSSVTRIRDKKGHVQGHVTLTHRVTLESYSMDVCSFEFHKQTYINTSSKIIYVAYLGART